MRRIVALLLGLVAAVASADEPRVILTGWNKPTATQFARDADGNQVDFADGTTLAVRVSGASNSNPFRSRWPCGGGRTTAGG